MGRPTKLTKELAQKITQKIRKGAYKIVAARECGINDNTFNAWMHKGRKGKKPYAQFALVVERAEAASIRKAEQTVYKEDRLAWLRGGPAGREFWGDQRKLIVSGDEEHPLRVNHENPVPVITFAQALIMVDQMGIVMDPKQIQQAEQIEQGNKDAEEN